MNLKVALVETDMMNFRYMLKQAYEYGQKNSHDSSTKLGALLYDPSTSRVIARGSNQYLTQRMRTDPRNHERPRKYSFIEHAERDVIFRCMRERLDPRGLVMIAPWACCGDCARAIVYAGISLVVTHKQVYDKSPERWRESIEEGREILADAGVAYYQWDGVVGDCTMLFDGEEWRP